MVQDDFQTIWYVCMKKYKTIFFKQQHFEIKDLNAFEIKNLKVFRIDLDIVTFFLGVGLLNQIQQSTTTMEEAEKQVLLFLVQQQVPEAIAPLVWKADHIFIVFKHRFLGRKFCSTWSWILKISYACSIQFFKLSVNS